MTIRPTTDADYDGLRLVLDEVARERCWLAMTSAPTLEMVSSFRQELRSSSSVDLVAVQERVVVGWIDIRRAPWEGMGHVGVLGMGVAAACRGQGIGRQLTRAALEAAAELGISRVELDVFASNTAAMALYRGHGFEEEGRKRRARVLDGRTDDIVVMARLG